jgi:hypothetical protein
VLVAVGQLRPYFGRQPASPFGGWSDGRAHPLGSFSHDFGYFPVLAAAYIGVTLSPRRHAVARAISTRRGQT